MGLPASVAMMMLLGAAPLHADEMQRAFNRAVDRALADRPTQPITEQEFCRFLSATESPRRCDPKSIQARRDAAEARKRAAREATGYKDPGGAVSLCPPPRRMTRDGCQ